MINYILIIHLIKVHDVYILYMALISNLHHNKSNVVSKYYQEFFF